MKNIYKGVYILLASAFLFASCDELMDVDSDRILLPDKHKIDAPNDTIYSMVGIFTQLKELSDNYVLLGELRGDLMTTTEFASPELVELNNLSVSRDNSYANIREYYSVINHCNYLIHNIDTSVISKAEKVLYKEFAAAKAIRAWTYMQIALNFGAAIYYEKPVLTIEAASAEYPEYSIEELAHVLIEDIEPWKDVPEPGSINLGSFVRSDNLFFPIRFVLGELYLWTGEFEKAAREFYDLIYQGRYVLTPAYQSDWEVVNNTFTEPRYFWNSMFSSGSSEMIAIFANSTEYGEGAMLDSLTFANFEVAPSEAAKNYWENQIYYHSATVLTGGDLRGENGSYFGEDFFLGNFSSNATVEARKEEGVISKFWYMSTTTSASNPVFRVGTLYLRYAEAVNRAGKSNLAFATLKNGLTNLNLINDSIVPPREKYVNAADSAGRTFLNYANFSDTRFANNIGVHARGSGNVHLAENYNIPALPSLEDSVLFVENMIIEELALETAFEGNRFHDLMRVAMRRNDPSFLADKVSMKHADNQSEIKAKLMDMNNWYLPSP